MDDLDEDESDTLDGHTKKDSAKQFGQYDFIRAQTFNNLDHNNFLQE